MDIQKLILLSLTLPPPPPCPASGTGGQWLRGPVASVSHARRSPTGRRRSAGCAKGN